MSVVTIRDVARLASVSVATVSRVLNGSAVVQPGTRARVLAAAHELRFSPNRAARSLITQRTQALGVILPDLYGEFFSELLRGIDQTAQRLTHHLLVSSSHHEPAGLAVAVRAMHGNVDGLLVMAPDVALPVLLELLPTGIPTVLLNGGSAMTNRAANVHSIVVDNLGGARTMTTHLLSLGHRRIGFIAGAAHNADAAERERGHRAAIRAAGIVYDGALCVRGDFDESGGARGARELMALADPPTAIFCANDAMAIGALSALRESGFDVPRQVAIAGFDDIPVARFLNPPLTSIRVGIANLGARGAERLIGALAAAPSRLATPDRELLPVELVVRASCGASTVSRCPQLPSPFPSEESIR